MLKLLLWQWVELWMMKVISAALGTAFTGETGSTTTLPAGQKIVEWY